MRTLAAVALTLAVVGGFMALDRTTLRWYVEAPSKSSPTAAPPVFSQPVLSELEARRVAQTQIATRDFPRGSNRMRCPRASYNGKNQMWTVTCEYYYDAFGPEDDEHPELIQTRLYLFSDVTGLVVGP